MKLTISSSFDSVTDIETLLEEIFSIQSNRPKYSDKYPELFILDGLDEVLVLSPKFDLESFIKKMGVYNELGVKVLITSRPLSQLNSLVFEFKEMESYLSANLEWKAESVEAWCKLYAEKKNNHELQEWIKSFISFYHNLADHLFLTDSNHLGHKAKP